jgi:general secretion pathway protein B
MSYILEALKKSEQERQIGHVPDISMVQETPRPVVFRWPRWLLIALVVNVLILSVIIWRPWEMRTAQPDSQAMAPTSTPAPVPAETQPIVDASVAEPASAPAVVHSEAPEVDLPAPVSQMPLPPPAPIYNPEPARIETEPVLPPRWQDLSIDERNNLPAPRIDVHVFAREPARRFVLINLRKYQEGDTIDGGATIESILADGIVLSYQGQRYRVERP